eukprot:765691-Hanusia_phi.AAC.1
MSLYSSSDIPPLKLGEQIAHDATKIHFLYSSGAVTPLKDKIAKFVQWSTAVCAGCKAIHRQVARAAAMLLYGM